MQKNTFLKHVVNELSLKYSHLEFTLNEVIKNNSVKLNGVIIKKKNSNVAPVIYLDSYYEDYQKGRSIETILIGIMAQYNTSANPNIDTERIKSFKLMKDKIDMKLINTNANLELINTKPSIKFLDLTILFYINFGDGATTIISNDMLNIWNKNIDDLKEITFDQHDCYYQSMNEVMKEILVDSGQVSIEDFDMFFSVNSNEMQMYVLTNKQKCFGAKAILDNALLSKLSDIVNDNLLILPSSIHECIAIPYNSVPIVDDARQMVSEVNGSEVSEEERLSENVYFFDRETCTLKVAL